MADGETAWEKNYQLLINDLFGTSSAQVKEILDAFYRNPSFDMPQLQQSFYYADRAEKKKNTADVKYRLNELELYLSYIDTWFQSLDEKKGSFEQREMSVYNMAWSLYEKKILHSYRIMQLVSYGFLNAQTNNPTQAGRYKDLHLQTFPETADKNAVWKKKLPDYDETLLISSKQSHQKNIQKPLASNKVSLEKQLESAGSGFSYAKKLIFQGNYSVRGYFTVYTKHEKPIAINWSLQNEKDKNPSLTISGVDKDYTAVYDFPLKGSGGSFTIKIPPGTTSFFVNASSYSTYKLSVILNGALAYFSSSPRGKMAFLDQNEESSYNPLYYPSYLYMPKNIEEVMYKVQLNALKIFAPEGKQIETKLVANQPGGFEIRRFNPTPNQTGKFWKVLISGNYNYEMLNIPDTYFLLEAKE